MVGEGLAQCGHVSLALGLEAAHGRSDGPRPVCPSTHPLAVSRTHHDSPRRARQEASSPGTHCESPGAAASTSEPLGSADEGEVGCSLSSGRWGRLPNSTTTSSTPANVASANNDPPMTHLSNTEAHR